MRTSDYKRGSFYGPTDVTTSAARRDGESWREP
jgi:hypothetical protein